MSNSRENLRRQLRALDTLFAAFQILDALEQEGRIVIHDLAPDDAVPMVAFTDENDWPLAQKIFGPDWAAVPCINSEYGPYVRMAKGVYGVRITCCHDVKNENRVEAA